MTKCQSIRVGVAAVLVVALAACTTGPGSRAAGTPTGGSDSVVLAGPLGAQIWVAETTVGFIQQWALVHLFSSSASSVGARPTRNPTSRISEEDRRGALAYAVALAERNTRGCKAVAARIVDTSPYQVQVQVIGCPYAVGQTSSPALDTASTVACLLPALPTGEFRSAQQAYEIEAGGPPPRRVESAAEAATGTWYLGTCSNELLRT
jgi:hypothetical protein